jgi:hypothetical protein
MMSCGTMGATMIRNSYGYDSSKQQRDALNLKEKKPDWHPTKDDESREKWEREKNPSGTLLFFYGESVRPIEQVEKMSSPRGKTKITEVVWDEENASNEAFQDAILSIGKFIDNQIVSTETDVVEEAVISETTSGRTKKTEQKSNIQARAQFSSQFEAKSSASFSGLRQAGMYTETLQQTINNKTITVTHAWVVYSISKDDIKEAKENIALERREAGDEKKRRESLEKREENYFAILMGEYEKAVASLSLNDISQYQSEERYRINYSDLLFVQAKLLSLETLKARDDETGNQYRSIVFEIGNKIEEYNPANRQRNSIGRLVSQQFIIPFPHRPSEIKLPQASIYAAKDMISNREYISFDSVEGTNSRPRRENGLDVTAVSVSWEEAARYCNFLSNFYGLTPCYIETNRQITSYDRNNNGYRLPNRDEIAAMLESQTGFIDEKEFSQIGIWSSDGNIAAEHTVYKLSAGSGAATGRLLPQSVRNTIADPSIGFRVVRNAE